MGARVCSGGFQPYRPQQSFAGGRDRVRLSHYTAHRETRRPSEGAPHIAQAPRLRRKYHCNACASRLHKRGHQQWPFHIRRGRVADFSRQGHTQQQRSDVLQRAGNVPLQVRASESARRGCGCSGENEGGRNFQALCHGAEQRYYSLCHRQAEEPRRGTQGQYARPSTPRSSTTVCRTASTRTR